MKPDPDRDGNLITPWLYARVSGAEFLGAIHVSHLCSPILPGCLFAVIQRSIRIWFHRKAGYVHPLLNQLRRMIGLSPMLSAAR